MINQIHWLRPYCLLLLIPMLVVLYMIWRHKPGTYVWQQICDKHLLNHLLVGRSRHRWLLFVWLSIAWVIAIIALAGPAWEKQPQPLYQSSQARVIVLDLSLAMYASDIKPDRLSRAKYKLRDMLQRNREGFIGLVVYTGEPFVVSPMTQDAATIQAMLPQLSPDIMPVEGSHLSAALDQAGELLKQAQLTKGQIIVIAASDPDVDAQATAQALWQKGYSTSILAVGTATGAPIATEQGFLKNNQGKVVVTKLNKPALQTVAAAGHGKLIELTNDDRDLNQLFVSNTQVHKNAPSTSAQTVAVLWRDEGYWLIVLLLPLVLLAFRRGWLNLLI
ncbi:MAG: VWA domain-containing protein [Gammaproteobacteria bacterium]